VLLLPIEHERNAGLKEISFNDKVWEFLRPYIRTELDFDNILKDKKDGICYPFIIIDKVSGRVVGSTRYGNINLANEKCEIGWSYCGIAFQGTGLSKAFKHERLKFGFKIIGFRRIQFNADEENLRSQRAVEKSGAKKEGVFINNYIDSQGERRYDIY